MKKLILFILYLVFAMQVVPAQNIQVEDDIIGKWKFEAPYSPEGYNTGIIEVGMKEKIYTVTIAFTGSEYTLPGVAVKVEKETLSFLIYLEEEDVKVTLIKEDAKKMSGKAVYSEGEVPLTLTKAEENK